MPRAVISAIHSSRAPSGAWLVSVWGVSVESTAWMSRYFTVTSWSGSQTAPGGAVTQGTNGEPPVRTLSATRSASAAAERAGPGRAVAPGRVGTDLGSLVGRRGLRTLLRRTRRPGALRGRALRGRLLGGCLLGGCLLAGRLLGGRLLRRTTDGRGRCDRLLLVLRPLVDPLVEHDPRGGACLPAGQHPEMAAGDDLEADVAGAGQQRHRGLPGGARWDAVRRAREDEHRGRDVCDRERAVTHVE